MKNFLFLVIVSMAVLTSCSKSNLGVDPSTTVTTSGGTVLGGAGGPLGDTIPTSSIPDSVRNYINTNYPGATITIVETEIRNGVTTYEVEILVGGVRKELYFSSTWVFLNLRNSHTGGNGNGHGENHDGRGDHDDRDSVYNVVIPAATLAQIHATYPNDTVIVGKREVHNGVITYEVIIKNGSTVRFLTYDANWVFVSIGAGDDEHHENNGGGDVVIAISAIPTTATTFISTTYAGYTITKAKSETERGVTKYEVQITNGTTKKWLIFSSAWVFLREEH